MTQFINYSADGLSVMLHHTLPQYQGTVEFEHKAMVALSALVNGTTVSGASDPSVLVATCPATVPNPAGSGPRVACGAAVTIPLTGGEEAQRLHAHVRFQRGQQPTYPQAVQAVITAVQQAGFTPAIQANDPLAG